MSEAAARPGSARTAWSIALLLATAHLVSFLDRSVLALVLQPIKDELHVGDAALGLLQGTAFAIFYALAAMPFGALADRIDRVWLVAGGIILWSVATAAGGLAHGYWGLFASRMMVGLGEAALVPAALAILADLLPARQLGRAIALFTAGASLGRSAAFAGGAVILGLLTAHGGLTIGAIGPLAPWRGLLVLLVLPGLALSAAILLLGRAIPRQVRNALPSRAVRLPQSAHRRLIAHIGAGSMLLLVGQSIIAWSPAYLGRVHGLPPTRAGLALGAIALIAAPLGHLAGGMATDLLRARGRADAAALTMMVALLCAMPCLAALAFAPSSQSAILAIGLVTLFVTAGSPAALSGLQLLVPAEARGRAFAWFLAITTLVGAGIGPMAVGLSTDLFGGGTAIRLTLPLIAGIAAAGGALLAQAARDPRAIRRD